MISIGGEFKIVIPQSAKPFNIPLVKHENIVTKYSTKVEWVIFENMVSITSKAQKEKLSKGGHKPELNILDILLAPL